MRVRHAVLLVGGRGTRLWPLTATLPKGLIPLAGTPFVEHQLQRLADIGVTHAWLAVSQDHASAWQEYAAGWSGPPQLSVSIETEPMDTAGPITLIADELDDRFLVLNGDVVFDVPLADFVADAPEAGIVLALARVPDPSAYGVVVTNDAGMVERFVEKPAPGTAPADTVNAGIYLMERRVLDGYDRGPLSFERRVFPELAERKELGAEIVEGSWLDIGTPELLLESHDALLGGRTRLAPARGHIADATATVAGERRGAWSWVGPGATVEEGAVIDEAMILGGAVVRAGAMVSQAVIGWRSVVEPSAMVSGYSLVGEDCVVGEGCELQGGIRLAPGTRLPPGSVTVTPPR